MTGLIQYWGLAAAAGTGASYTGIITGGRHQIPSAVIEDRGIGNHVPYEITPGLVTAGGTVDFIVQDNLILLNALRTAGALSEFGVVCGDTTWAATHKYCKSTGLTLRCTQGDRLTGTMSWLSKQASETSGAQTQLAAVDIPLLWNTFVITGTGLTTLVIDSFEITLRNNLEQRGTLATPGSAIRMPIYVHDLGQDLINLNFTCLAQGGADITADALAGISTIVITFAGSAKTLTLTLTGCEYAEKNDDFTPNAMATKGINLLCTDLAVTYAA